MKSDSRLRILHIASWYPSAVHASLGNFIQRHVEAISKFHTCELWYASPVSDVNPLLGTVEVNSRGNFVEKIAYPKATKPGVRAVTRALLKLSPGEEVAMPDIVHLHVAFPAGRAARIFADQWGVPLIVTEHWTAYHDSSFIPLWRRISMRRTAQSTSFFCPVTDQLGEKMREFGMNNENNSCMYRTIPNVVDTEQFHVSEEHNEGRKIIKLLHVSSLDEAQKNITGILQALGQLRMTKPEMAIETTFVGGTNPDRLSKLRKYATELGLVSPIVNFTGPLSIDDVARIVREADALMLFSRKENFPCVIAEAWASGVPVISTNVGGIAEHLNTERGVLIENDDEEGLVNAILKVAATEFDSASIRKYAVENFSVSAISTAYDKVYREALAK